MMLVLLPPSFQTRALSALDYSHFENLVSGEVISRIDYFYERQELYGPDHLYKKVIDRILTDPLSVFHLSINPQLGGLQAKISKAHCRIARL